MFVVSQHIYIDSILYITSSTAQGGGGSFKNRKPIGEVGCCESRMAERIRWWTDRWLSSPLFLSLSLFLSVSLSLSFSDYLPTCWSSNFLSAYLSLCRPVCLSIISTCLSASLKTKIILGDFLIFWTWQHPKRSNSARLLQFLNLTTSKMWGSMEVSGTKNLTPTENFSVEVIFGGTWRAMSDQCWAVLEDTLGTTILEGLTSKTVLAGSLY